MRVLEVIQKSTEFLARRGVESPRLQSELMLARIRGVPRLRLYLDFDQVLSEREIDLLRGMVKRRGDREPLQHILGGTSFCGLELACDNRTLIPRPETEVLAELGWKRAEAWGEKEPVVMDIGTGSGCIAIAVAHHCPRARIIAVDASAEALEAAAANAARHQVDHRIQFLQGGRLSELGALPPAAVIVSNPPYIPSSEIAGLEPEVRCHDPHLALDGGVDGLEVFRMLAQEAGSRLAPGGEMLLEHGLDQADALASLLEKENWIVRARLADYSGRQRYVVAAPGRAAGVS